MDRGTFEERRRILTVSLSTRFNKADYVQNAEENRDIRVMQKQILQLPNISQHT